MNRPWYEVVFAGGEPTIHPHLSDAIQLLHENLRERLNHVTIITNGSRNKTFYQNIAEFSKFMSIDMLISIHTDHVEMEHICDLIKNLSNKVNIRFALMFNPAKRERVFSIYETLLEYRKKFPFTMGIPLLREDDHIDPRYIKKDIEWQEFAVKKFNELVKQVPLNFSPTVKRKHNSHLFYDIEYNGKRVVIEEYDHNLKLTNGLLNFKGMFCTAHTAILRIDANGLCRGMVCGADPFICNIFQENSLLANRDKLMHIIQCPYEMCGCSTNDPIPKFSSLYEASHFIKIAKEKQNILFDTPAPSKLSINFRSKF